MTDTADCPKCGKKSLVMRHQDLYQCLVCDFKKDFIKDDDEKDLSKPSEDLFWAFAVPVVIAVILLL